MGIITRHPYQMDVLYVFIQRVLWDILMREERRQKIRKEKRNQAGIYRIRNYSYFRGKAN